METEQELCKKCTRKQKCDDGDINIFPDDVDIDENGNLTECTMFQSIKGTNRGQNDA